MKILITSYQSPVGELLLGSYGDRLCLCDWAVGKHRTNNERSICRSLQASYEPGTSPVIEAAITQLEEYFAGNRTSFSIPLLFTGTPFQRQARHELERIPYAETISYSQQARRLGNPRAVRAVAAANATNPIAIFVPCHRVIGQNRRLTGYAGGLPAKEALILLEQRVKTSKSKQGGLVE